MKKHLCNGALLCCFLMVCAGGFAQKSAKVITLVDGGLALNGMSPNGKWAALNAGSQTRYYNATLWNLETGETTLLFGPDDTNESQMVANDVDDSGIVVGSYDNVPAYYKNGEWTQLPVPEGYPQGEAKGVSADGSVIVGYASDGSMENGKACKWVNGQLVDMTIPETDSRGVKVDTPQLFNVSADGSVIWGFLNFTYLTSCTPVVWAPEPQTVCEDLYYNENGERNYTSIYENTMGISPNGKFLTGHIDYDLGSSNSDGAFLYDVQTKKSKVYLGENGEVNTRGCILDNDGVIYEATNIASSVREAYMRIDGIQHDMTNYLKEEYNYDLKTETSMTNFGTTVAVSEDGKTVVGFEGPGGNWCIKYSVAPGAKGSAIESNETNKVTVSMSGKIMVIDGNAQNVTITDPTGKVVMNQTLNGSTVDLAGLPLGIYVATVTSDGQQIVKKIALK